MKYQKEVFKTSDGSMSIRVKGIKETYHSRHGALTESQFVYIKEGLDFCNSTWQKSTLRILELGYGTGLVAYLTYLNSINFNTKIDYVSIDPFPINSDEVQMLHYDNLFLKSSVPFDFNAFSALEWNETHPLSPFFSITKKIVSFQDFECDTPFDLLYYDAFGAHAQPELWESQWMIKSAALLNQGGIWVSYCAKGSVRRGLELAGFEVFRLPGPPGKREMMRALKR